MNKKTIIAVVGMPGAGKSEAIDFLISQGFNEVYFGSAILDGLKKEGLEINANNEDYYRSKIRRELGMEAVAVKLMPKIKKALDMGTKVAINGLYSWEEYTYLRKEIDNLLLLCIYASPRIRYERLALRKDRTLTNDEASERDVRELEKLNKGGPIAIADYLIKNEGTKEDLNIRLQEFLDSIK